MQTKRLVELNLFPTNDYEIEQNFRETCLWYESKFSISNQTSSQAYQKYINNYHKAKSLYLIVKGWNDRTHLAVYDTEREREEVKILKTPLGVYITKCIILLPNDELFCFGESSSQDKALIYGRNYDFRLLPSPSGPPLFYLSAIYFNSSVYFLGGLDKSWNRTTLSRKFDLNENRWINLTPMPKADSSSHGVVFNENILICGFLCKNILLYSVDIDSFSTIPYEFSQSKRKILINAERLYLIECKGFIYESEVENEYAWENISNSIIPDGSPYQIFCVYNKGEIYISEISSRQRYFKFDLKQKIMTMIK